MKKRGKTSLQMLKKNFASRSRRQLLKLGQSRGQVTIFIIVAIIIIVLGVLLYLFFPQIQTTLGLTDRNPSAFMQTCMGDEIKETVKILSLQGGSLNPKNYFLYDNERIEYLCYTNEYYIPCVVQQPILKQHIENEIKNNIESKTDSCFESLKNSFESQGYIVNFNRGETNVELLPQRIIVTFEKDLSLTKGDTETYDQLDVVINNNLYELISISNSILNMESKYGDSETTIYMNYYHDLKVEKKKQSDGTTIYILTNRDTGDKFQFASRSIAWPPGISP